MTLDGNVARIGEMKNVHKILVGRPKGRGPLKELGENGKIILEWILEN
jgi:hypothetical protein